MTGNPANLKLQKRQGNRFLGPCLLLLMAFPGYGQPQERDLSIPTTARRALKRDFLATVNGVVEQEVEAVRTATSSRTFTVDVQVEFDDDRYKVDRLEWEDRELARIKNLRDEAVQYQKTIIESLIPAKKMPTGGIGQLLSVPDKIRFGSLNLDIESKQAASAFDDDKQAQVARAMPSLNVQLPIQGADLPATYEYDVHRYISKLAISIALPADLTVESEQRIRERIYQLIEISSFSELKPEEVVAFTRLPVHRGYEIADWVSGVFQPGNNGIILVMLALAIGLIFIGSTLVLAKAFRQVASGISSLKPEPVISNDYETKSDQNSQEVAGDSIIPVLDSGSTAPTRKIFDSAANSHALTAEMKTIREQFAEIVQSYALAVAEQLRESFYSQVGLADFRDLLSFCGYPVIKPAVELLPKSCILALESFLDEEVDSNISLLNGVEIAQRVYRDVITKIATENGSNPTITELRKIIILTEDSALEVLSAELTPEESVVLLKVLSFSRGAKIVRASRATSLRQAINLLDTPLDQLTNAIQSLVTKLSESEIGDAHTAASETAKFILRLVRNATYADEDDIDSLVGVNDKPLRRKMMHTRLFLRDIVYIKSEVIRSVLTSFDVAYRGDILFAMGDELAQHMISSFQEGSKLKEMLVSELDLIKKAKVRSDVVRLNKFVIIERFMHELRLRLHSDPSLIEDAIAKKFSRENGTDSREQSTAA